MALSPKDVLGPGLKGYSVEDVERLERIIDEKLRDQCNEWFFIFLPGERMNKELAKELVKRYRSVGWYVKWHKEKYSPFFLFSINWIDTIPFLVY